MSDKSGFPLFIKEKDGIERFFEPVSIGIPFPKGNFRDISLLNVSDQDGVDIPFAVRVLDTWSDGSLKWVLFDVLISMGPHTEKSIKIEKAAPERCIIPDVSLSVKENEAEFIAISGGTEFHVDKRLFRPFNSVIMDGYNLIDKDKSPTILTDKNGNHWTPNIEQSSVEYCNAIRATLLFEGRFSKGNVDNDLLFQSRLSFYAGHSFCMIEFTILNPKSAAHPGGFWDLGGPGSIFFKDLSINIATNFDDNRSTINYKLNNDPSSMSHELKSMSHELNCHNNIVIYQDSSGGENWNSRNHVNHLGKISLSFKGYRVYQSDKTIEEGLRATPIMSVKNGRHAIAGTMKHFWQNFPSAIESNGRNLKISPFPRHYNDLFELQGGEQKTHQIFIDFSDQSPHVPSLAWIHNPLVVQVSPDWYCKTKVLSYVVQKSDIPTKYPYKESVELAEVAIKGENTFFDRREIIDEYGWRNFGDQYADHENRLYLGEKPIISHYNNQYDLLNSFIFQYISTGDGDWFRLADELARHVIDTDIYHTDQDRSAYNRGLFWHTDHFATAATATHRGFSHQTIIEDEDRKPEDGPAAAYLHGGSGPSPQHLYTQGLLNYYFLTGDSRARYAVLELADFVIRSIRGPEGAVSLLKVIAKNAINWVKKNLGEGGIRPYGLLKGPDRGSGNALNTLLDAFILTKKSDFMSTAEHLIKECVHPKDDLTKRNLLDINMRWSYTIFLQAVGKYLDIRTELGETDYMYFYAKDTLLHYAVWMLDHEVPIMDFRDSFDFPNFETRAANDIRKANVLYLASKYAPEELRKAFREKAKFFFEDAVKSLLSFETRTHTRPLAILMQNLHASLYFYNCPDESLEEKNPNYDYGSPKNHDSLRWLATENLRLFSKILAIPMKLTKK